MARAEALKIQPCTYHYITKPMGKVITSKAKLTTYSEFHKIQEENSNGVDGHEHSDEDLSVKT